MRKVNIITIVMIMIYSVVLLLTASADQLAAADKELSAVGAESVFQIRLFRDIAYVDKMNPLLACDSGAALKR